MVYQTNHLVTEIDPRDKNTPDEWVPRHPELVRLTGRHPFNCEPPLEHLRAFITPTSLHYVRNHGPVPRLEWSTHQVTVDGLVDRTRSFGMEELLWLFEEAIVEIPVLLVCAGNRRKEQNMIKKSIGFSWGGGAASTSVWTGIPLHKLLEFCGVDKSKAKYVWFEGSDVLPHDNYGTCIPAHTALDPACDVLVAWKINGEHLTPDHGYPLRMIIPGHIGGRMVKWLRRIHVSDRESDNRHHLHDNRVLPSHVDAELATAENWWAKPEYVINELNVNSIFLSPAHDEKLTVNAQTLDQDMYTVSGYAYTGGGRKIIRVEFTLDDGLTWQLCRIKYTEKPNAYGRWWCWVQYELEIPVVSLCGTSEICVRAWDASMNTQPEFPTWNVMGMMNNPWFRVKIHQINNGQQLHFEHPTNAGSLKGGWMTAERIQSSNNAGASSKRQQQLAVNNQKEDETDKKENDKAQIATPSIDLDKLQWITPEEVANHSTKESCWFICRGLVYDATKFLTLHPGGATSILLCGGTDCTEEFESIHSTKAWAMLAEYCIGRCTTDSNNEPETDSSGDDERSECDAGSVKSTVTQVSSVSSEDDNNNELKVALKGTQKVPLVLISKEIVSHDSRIFRFALPEKDMVLGLPIGNHVFLYGKVNGKIVVRAYTPISSNDEPEDIGFISFLIKVYFATENSPGGMFSQYLDDLHLGSRIEMKGPLGHFRYYDQGVYSLEAEKFKANKFGLIAGGTGITPVYQLMRAILTNPLDTTRVHVIYCVRKEEDLLLRDELEALQRLRPDTCRLYMTLTDLDNPLEANPNWTQGVERINLEMIREVIGVDASHVAMCGPEGMIEYGCIPALAKLGYSQDALTVL